MLPNVRGGGASSVTKQAAQAILDTSQGSPMQQVKAKLSNSKAFHSPSPSDQYVGYGVRSP